MLPLYRYCPHCNKAGLRRSDSSGAFYWQRSRNNFHLLAERWCPRCHGWVSPVLPQPPEARP